MRFAIFTLALMSASSLAAQSLDGLYFDDYSDPAEACSQFGMTDAAIEIESNRVTFFETVCTLSNPVDIREMPATIYEAACNMEGEMSNERMIIYEVLGGIAILHAGAARTYMRCE